MKAETAEKMPVAGWRALELFGRGIPDDSAHPGTLLQRSNPGGRPDDDASAGLRGELALHSSATTMTPPHAAGDSRPWRSAPVRAARNGGIARRTTAIDSTATAAPPATSTR